MGPLIKHAGWILNLVDMLPESLSACWIPGSSLDRFSPLLTEIGWSDFLKMKNDILAQIISIKSTENTSNWKLDVSHGTIFHDLISSKLLPAEEKAPSRLAQEGQILVQGGTLTTSWVLSLAVFHLLSNTEILSRLRDELRGAMPNPDDIPALADLEALPYLRAVVKEAFRYGVGTSGRLPRVAPDEALFCRDGASGLEWRLPPGCVVSMSPYLTVMDDKLFPEPLSFQPERWLGAVVRRDKYLVVFSNGTRICLGMALANAEVHLMLAKLLRVWGDANDRREGDVGTLELFKTTTKDCQMASDYFIPIPYKVRDKTAQGITANTKCRVQRVFASRCRHIEPLVVSGHNIT